MRTRRRQGFSLVEVTVAIAILMIGIVGIVKLFPPSLKTSSEAAVRGRAVLLAQAKLAELRRDNDKNNSFTQAVLGLATPTTPVPFAADDRLAYQYSPTSEIAPDGDPNDPAFDPGVARIIIRYNSAYRPSGDVVYELRFDGVASP